MGILPMKKMNLLSSFIGWLEDYQEAQNTYIKQKLLNRGLDPQTHRPLNQIHNHSNFNKYTVNNNEEIMHSSTHYQENLDLELSIGLASSESADSIPLQQRQQPQQ
ncbi:hypothetical protein CUMW_228090 [Citrus unshiu]|uniref:Uncharacterized protein n=1 Tax=Citrus unshiu TaxID=55188 RepID=A0A2H5QGI9_CITUN|nr:hypothetical protein CUMW_228090 [Citrus unshiu]